MDSNKEFVTKITEILVHNGSLSPQDAERLVRDFVAYNQAAFDEFLLSSGIISKNELLAALSTYYQVPAIDVQGEFFDPGLIQAFPEDFLIHYQVIPMEVDEAIMTVVAARPDLPNLAGKIEEISGYVTEFRVGYGVDIVAMVRHYCDDEVYTDRHMTQDEACELIEEDDLHILPDDSI